MNENFFAGLDGDTLVNRLADVAEAALSGQNAPGSRPAKPASVSPGASQPLPWKIIGLVVGAIVLLVVGFKMFKGKK